MSNLVKKRTLIQLLAISPPSSPSPTSSLFSSSSSSSSTRTSPTPSLPSPSTTSTSTSGEQPPAAKKPKRFFKWTDRVGLRRHDDEKYDYYASGSSSSDEGSDSGGDETWSVMDTNEDHFLDVSSTSSTRKRTVAKNDDDDEDEDNGSSSPNMALADYDAGDLKTPAYATHGTPGTAIRMMNGVALGGGSPFSGVSASTPTGPIDSETVAPCKLSEYQGFQKAWAEIHELALFEEDLEYADGTETIQQFLDRMEERERKPQEYDQDINSGADFSEAHYVPYPQVNVHLENKSGGDWSDTKDKTKTLENHENGDVTPKGDHCGMTFCHRQEQIQDAEFSTLSKDACTGQVHKFDDNLDWINHGASDQKTMRGIGSEHHMGFSGSNNKDHVEHEQAGRDDSDKDADEEGNHTSDCDDDVETGDMTGVSSVPADTSASA
ncbi:hypothetical protein BGX24_010685 [Mortierella sp. AD032]|nr:hypothetical protein BGX24_010685 [Mortierella sp. AD032]